MIKVHLSIAQMECCAPTNKNYEEPLHTDRHDLGERLYWDEGAEAELRETLRQYLYGPTHPEGYLYYDPSVQVALTTLNRQKLFGARRSQTSCDFFPRLFAVRCVQCGRIVEKARAREVYFTPTCYVCLPPPEPLPINHPHREEEDQVDKSTNEERRERIERRKVEGRHSYDGACAPHNTVWASQETFSLGIFQWVPKANGEGLKRGPVRYRVYGRLKDAERVYQRAEELCDLFDKGLTSMYLKSETIHG